MATVKIYNLKGEVVGDLKLSEKIFDVKLKNALVNEASVAQQTNSRIALAHTKTRGEVRGGGKKPWKQKGTGRARHGSTRSPIWVGGGITFGPRRDRTFDIKVNRKVRRQAICMVLSERVAENKFVALDELTIAGGKTNILSAGMKKLPSTGKSVLLVIDPKNMDARRAAQNLQKVTTIAPNSLNVRDLLKFQYIVAPKAEIETITKTFGG